MPRITIELSDELKAAFACTEAEQGLAIAMADLVFSEAREGIRPLVYIELAARILADPAALSISHQNTRGGKQLDAKTGASAMLSYVYDRTMELMIARDKIAYRAQTSRFVLRDRKHFLPNQNYQFLTLLLAEARSAEAQTKNCASRDAVAWFPRNAHPVSQSDADAAQAAVNKPGRGLVHRMPIRGLWLKPHAAPSVSKNEKAPS